MNNTLSAKALTLLLSGVQPIITWEIGSFDYLDDAEINDAEDGQLELDTTVHVTCAVTVGDETSEFSRRFSSTASLDQDGSLRGSFGILDDWEWNEWIELDSEEQAVFDYLQTNYANQLIPQWSHLSKETTQAILNFLQTKSELEKS